MEAMDLAAKQRMLRLWSALGDARCARPVAVVTTDATVVRAASLISNGSQSLLAVTQLETPLGTYPHSVLRARDVLSIDATLTTEQLDAILGPS